MKKRIQTCICFCILMVISTGINAQQLPNRSFETWKSGNKIPEGWNVLTVNTGIFPITSNSVQVPDKYSGNYAVKLTSVNALGKVVPGFLSLGTAIVSLSDISAIEAGGISAETMLNYFSNGYPIQNIPEKIEGYYKAASGNPMIFAFAKRNGELVTSANATGLSAQNDYTKFTLNFSDTAAIPDTLYMAFITSVAANATLTLDSLSIFYRLYTNGVKTDYFSDNQKISKTFNFTGYKQKNYYDTVEYEYDSVNLSSLAAFPVGAGVSVENGARSLKSGMNNSFNITITDPYNAGRTETYSLNIYRKTTPGVSKINVSSYIKGNTVKESEREANYDATDNSYHVSFLNEIDSISVECELPSEKLKYEVITFVDSLVVGANNFVIRVSEKSDPGNSADFNLVVTRQASNYTPSENANLQSLKFIVNGNEEIFSPVFHADSLHYIIGREIPYLDSVAKIEAQLADVNAQVTGKGTVNLTKGSNMFTITVMAENGITTKEYTIIVNRNEGNNANLKSLVVKNNDTLMLFTPNFNVNTVNYSCNVGSNVENINITTMPFDENAKVEIKKYYKAEVTEYISTKGEKNIILDFGVNPYKIIVTAVDGITQKEYIMDIYKETLSVEKAAINLQDITLYPNPTKDIVKISGITGSAKVEIYDTKGNLLGMEMLSEKQDLNLSKYPKGSYVLKIQFQGNIVIRAVVLK